MTKALVTGSTGFIGSRLVRVLVESGVEVRGLSRASSLTDDWASSVDQIQADISRRESVANIADGCDTIFHCAGYAHTRLPRHIVGDSLHHRVSVDGTRFLLSAAKMAGVKRFVFLSSIKATGDHPTRCLSEHDLVESIDGYGSARRTAEALVLRSGRDAGMHVCNLRPALVYGPGVKGNLAKMIAAIDRGRFPGVPETGNRRSMVHVDDLVQAMLAVSTMSSANNQTYHVTDGYAYSTRQIYEWMSLALGRPLAKVMLPALLLRTAARFGDVAQRVLKINIPLTSATVARLLDSACYSNDHLCKDIGFQPQYDLETSMEKIVSAWRAAGSV